MPRRAPHRYLTAAFRRGHYRTLVRTPLVVSHPIGFARRYLIGGGTYPCTVTVRTPVGPVGLRVESGDDVVTVAEVFCREDYRAGRGVRAVVDIGSNIGISAAYFLTRNPVARVWCFEPAPSNLPRLRDQLRAFGDRAVIQEVAVGPTRGTIDFGLEPTGRLGTAADIPDGYERISVRCEHVNDVIAGVLAEAPRIDVLKLDTEGWEVPTLEALAPELAERIDVIVFEGLATVPSSLAGRFDAAYREPVNRLTRRAAGR